MTKEDFKQEMQDIIDQSDCETCQNRKTCKDAPIPPRYYCLGYKQKEKGEVEE